MTSKETAPNLDELEQRVGEKWAAIAASRLPAEAFDLSQWAQWGDIEQPPTQSPPTQFPRERWASYPARRTVTLLTCDRMLDFADALTDEQWMTVCFLMQYGGKTRLS